MKTRKMKKMQKGSLTLIVFFLLAQFAALAQAGMGRGYRSGDCPRGNWHERVPGITSEQEDKIETLRDKHWDEMKNLHAELREAESWEERDQTMDKIIAERRGYRDEVREVLNAEQNEWLFEKRGEYRRQGSGKGRPSGRGKGRGNPGGCPRW
jgi:hypothetical protein